MSPFLTLGILLLVAHPVGRLCARFNVPRVTGYLLAGLALGPSGLARFAEHLPAFTAPLLLSPDVLGQLKPVSELAQAIILFVIGLSLQVDRLRSAGRTAFAVSAVEVAGTFLLVTGLTLVVLGPDDLALALVLGAVAVATAPAATLLVLRDLEAEGPNTRRILVLVGLDNIASLVLFAVLFGVLFLGNPLGSLAALGLGAAEGVGVGLLVGAILMQVSSARSQTVIGLAGILAAWGLARATGANPLLSCLLLGTTLTNGSPYAGAVLDRLKQFDYPIYVAFFVLAGANLHLDYLLGLHPPPGQVASTVLLVTLAYIAGRTLAKVLSGRVAGHLLGATSRPVRLTGLALLAQAGLAIALADSAVRSGVEGALLLQAVVLASVAVFELVGPLAVRYAAVHSGEVKILNLVPERLREGLGAGFRDTLERLRRTLGLPTLREHHDERAIRAQDVMRRNFEPIRANMHFEDVIHTFAGSPYDQHPVTDADGVYLGVISFKEIRTILFDDALEEVVIAADLITGPGVTCTGEAPLEEVIRIFEDAHGEFSTLLVVAPGDSPRVLGIIHQREAMVAFRRHG